MELRIDQHRVHPGWWTALLVAVLAAAMWLCSALFTGILTPTVPVTVVSDRAGLVLETGAKVKLRGVQIGQVVGVEKSPQSVQLTLALDPGQMRYIPANVEAQIRATSAFGAKYVDIITPPDPSPQHLTAGARIASRNVTTEVNTVFENLVSVLNQVEPAKLNSVLSAVADAVAGRGQRIGEAATATSHVLDALNPRTPAIEQNWDSLRRASDAYGIAAQDVLKTLDAVGTTSETVTAHARELDALLLSLIGLADTGSALVGSIKDDFVHTADTLAPTTGLLLKYNPTYTCMLMGAKWFLDNGGYQAFGGNGRSVILDSTFLFGDDPYRYPDNLPRVAAKGGPDGKPGCGSLPDASKNFPVRALVTDTGWGTGLDMRPNPGIGHPFYIDYFPVTRAVPELPSVRGEGQPAIGPVPYPGAPAYGAPLYAPDGSPLYPPPPGPPQP